MKKAHLVLGIVGIAALGTTFGATARFGIGTPGNGLLFNGWTVTPKGEHTQIGDMAFKLVASPDGREVITTSQGFKGVHLTTLDAASHKIIQDLKLPSLWNGVCFSKDGKTLFVGTGNGGGILSFAYDAGKVTQKAKYVGEKGAFISGLAFDGGKLYACDEANAQVLVLDSNSLTVTGKIGVGNNPHTACFGADPRYLYVSAWGANQVDVVDTQTSAVIRRLSVGTKPNDMALAPDGRLFVACSGDNSVHVIQTRQLENRDPSTMRETRIPEGTREILNTALEPTRLEGSTPVGVSVAKDGKTLYVANADNNDVMVADISDRAETKIRGFIPTGWYPTSVLSLGDQLLVAEGKGLTSRPNAPAQGARPILGRQKQKFDYIGDTFQGYVSFMPTPSASQLESYTQEVYANTPFRVKNIQQTAAASDSVVPDKVGAGSPVKHILYVVMENRTYDQVLGDMKEGNGDPSLCMYGEAVTPNRHKLARDYVLLDNLYCNGEVSVDGHAWSDGAIASDANQRQWTSGYSSHGDVTGSDDVQLVSGDYIWEAAIKAGLSVKTYGEGANSYLGGRAVASKFHGTWKGARDMTKVDGFIKDVRSAEESGDLPNFMIMSLGEDHTTGTRAGTFTPEAAVGSNDQAIGKIVESLSNSRFWSSTAIFIMEDDAQNGPDHVDSHRTYGQVISPYVKRHFVDHTMYTTVSMMRTMELLLGLAPLTQYDAAAVPMFNCFMKEPVAEPYALIPTTLDLMAKNTDKSIGATLSAKMDFSDYDRAPAALLNQVLWEEAKGKDVPYPALRRSVPVARP